MPLILNVSTLIIAIIFFHVLSFFTKLMDGQQLVLSIVIWMAVGALLILVDEVKRRKNNDEKIDFPV